MDFHQPMQCSTLYSRINNVLQINVVNRTNTQAESSAVVLLNIHEHQLQIQNIWYKSHVGWRVHQHSCNSCSVVRLAWFVFVAQLLVNNLQAGTSRNLCHRHNTVWNSFTRGTTKTAKHFFPTAKHRQTTKKRKAVYKQLLPAAMLCGLCSPLIEMFASQVEQIHACNRVVYRLGHFKRNEPVTHAALVDKAIIKSDINKLNSDSVNFPEI